MTISPRIYFMHNLLGKIGLVKYVGILIFLLIPFSACLAGVFVTDGFESGNLSHSENGFKWGSSTKASVSTEKPKSGKYSLRVAYPAVPNGKDSWAEQRFHLGGFYPELWIKYDLYVPTNYYHRNQQSEGYGSDNNKGYAFIWAGSYEDITKREGPMLGPGFWPNGDGSSRVIMWASASVNGVKLLNTHWFDDPNGKNHNAITLADRGHWMNIVIHAKYASQSNDDGVYELWKTDYNGSVTKLIDIHNGPWYATQPLTTTPARGFAEGYLLGWSNSGFDNDTVFYIDNFEVSNTSLLDSASAVDKTPPPNPPDIR